jgi:ribosomal protein S12 methylthiotransferase accessory factor
MIITSGGGKKVNASYEGMTILTDQSVDNGGDGSAPEPFSLFLASIGTCAGIYVYSFCKARDIPVDDIRVVQRHYKNEDGKGIAKISLTIEVPDTFPEKYRAAIIRAADLCAVKKAIINAPEFSVTTEVKTESNEAS